uniref:N-acetyltransferase domain-containing protein n=1 Tax=viral metagenome TaxID=1070528 RepID=A0A6C0IFV0_9ZZZZ
MNVLQYSSLIDIIKNNKSSLSEINSQYTQLLSLLTKINKLSDDFFLQKVQEICSMGEIFICYFLDNKDEINIIGSGSIIYEPKIIHSGKYVGHIEDIIVNEKYRNLGIARSILTELKKLAYVKDCYKVILDCSEENRKFYEKNDFLYKGIQMAVYF